jgi:hypothetical protein
MIRVFFSYRIVYWGFFDPRVVEILSLVKSCIELFCPHSFVFKPHVGPTLLWFMVLKVMVLGPTEYTLGYGFRPYSIHPRLWFKALQY